MPKTVAELVTEAMAQVENVSPKDASAEVASGKAAFLDVREPVEWEHHIAGAVRSPPVPRCAPPSSPARATAPSRSAATSTSASR
jgi:rhodanese-related sulfurtransferase